MYIDCVTLLVLANTCEPLEYEALYTYNSPSFGGEHQGSVIKEHSTDLGLGR